MSVPLWTVSQFIRVARFLWVETTHLTQLSAYELLRASCPVHFAGRKLCTATPLRRICGKIAAAQSRAKSVVLGIGVAIR
jgi:hypothetical protein